MVSRSVVCCDMVLCSVLWMDECVWHANTIMPIHSYGTGYGATSGSKLFRMDCFLFPLVAVVFKPSSSPTPNFRRSLPLTLRGLRRVVVGAVVGSLATAGKVLV